MTKTAAEIAAYYDAFLPYMERDAAGTNPRREHIKGILRQILKPGMTVLEPGCGIGLNSIFMAQELGCKVTAIDISPKLIKAAQRMHPHENIEYVCGAFPDVDFGEQMEDLADPREFDAVVLCDVLEHVPGESLNDFVEEACFRAAHDAPVYVNVPNSNYQSFIEENAPDLQQIVDAVIHPAHIALLFGEFEFSPVYMNIYGIDAPYQYQEYVFLPID
ncbi:MAG: methyltransferase domain-containing protein, partial [Bacteroidales bacterium]|nr:methyltransferase domain-containing protein [Bacteroidales bacterium]